MVHRALSRACLAGAALLVACSNTPDPKSPEGEATVEVTPVAEPPPPPPRPELSPTELPESRESPPPEPETEEPPPPPLAPATGPTATSGGTAAPAAATAAPAAQLATLAPVEAPGMLPVGNTLAGTFKTGDTLEFQLTLAPGRCYTVLANGASSVKGIELVMGATMIPLPPLTLAQASGVSKAAIGGAGTGCFKNPMPLPISATVTLKVTSGSGVAGVMVLAK